MNLEALCDDLLAERADLEALLEPLDADGWATATPAEGWTVLDQVTHLAWFDDDTRRAIVDPTAFRQRRDRLTADVDAFVSDVVERGRTSTGPDALAWLRESGPKMTTAALAADATARMPWYGPDMSIASAITARIMETWAHGQDIADALGLERAPSPRLPHVAYLGWRALPHSFRTNGLTPPTTPVRIETPDLVLGPQDATDVVRGSLLDLCLLVTQRRHLGDTDLSAEGDVATAWLTIAQAFAGPPGAGRTPGQFT